ncbi:MAG: hypothetical protein ACRDD1_08830 [Planctomycetia bacterium]
METLPFVPDPRRMEVMDEAVAAVLRKMTPSQRVEMAVEMNETARRLIADYLRGMNPTWDEAQVAAEVVRRMTRQGK